MSKKLLQDLNFYLKLILIKNKFINHFKKKMIFYNKINKLMKSNINK
jgi:hypothetical protein